jgi:SAM-dependent methyltransferase
MVAVARSRLARRVAVRQARAEVLPFKEAWFDRAVARLVVHLLDRPRAFAELARVVAPGGRAAVASFDSSHFEGYWLNALFPSLEAIDRARFPSAETLTAELRGGGFRDVRIVRRRQDARVTREAALERVRGRYISTLRLLPEQEYRDGLERAERELPDEIAYRLDWIVAIAER